MWGNVGRRSIRRPRLKLTSERMFLGQYKYTTDLKGRLTIPVRFRAALASGAFVTQGFERNLMVYTSESFDRLAKKASALTSTDPEARAVRRVIFGGATEVSLDSAGRVLLPDFLRDYAGIDGEAFIVGAGEYFEIWRAKAWEQERAAVMDSEANAKRFADYDLSTG
ncbi:MAG: division/cell wall cluster transcriptional repressor MraZ [Anaerolineales bacterium]